MWTREWFACRRPGLVVAALVALACGADEPAGQDTGAETGAASSDGSADTVAGTSTETGAGTADETADPGPTYEIEMIQIEVGAMTFDARAAGPVDGELLLLLHGFPQTSYEFIDIILPLAEAGYRVVAPNQRGYSPGARPSELQAYLLPELRADVLGMADALGAETFHLGAHDWGAHVAWGVAAENPDRVMTLTAISSPHLDARNAELMDQTSCQWMASAYFDLYTSPGYEAIMLANEAMQLLATWTDSPPEAIEDYMSVLGNTEALRAALSWYRANIEDRVYTSPPYGPVSVPALYIVGEDDAVNCPEPADATAELVTGPYTYERLPGVNHWVPELAPDAVVESMLTLLAG